MQKKIFLKTEGDSYYKRNKSKKNVTPFFFEICDFLKKEKLYKEKLSVIDVGSSNGIFLSRLKKKFKNFRYFGLDPSIEALKNMRKGITPIHGTADKINLKSNSIDILIYGFSLYLTDLEDHKRISLEANRILKKNGYLILYDFFSKKMKKVKYKHHKKIKVIKFDFDKIFSKDKYFLFFKKIIDYDNNSFIYSDNNLISLSILKKLK